MLAGILPVAKRPRLVGNEPIPQGLPHVANQDFELLRHLCLVLQIFDTETQRFSREESTASTVLPTFRRIRDFLKKDNKIPSILDNFVKCLIDSINTRVEKLVGNKLLRISTLLDPRFSYDETIFSKAHWGFIEEDLIEFIKKENLKITTQEDNFVTSSLDEIDSLSDKSDDSVTRYDIWRPKSPGNVSTISVNSQESLVNRIQLQLATFRSFGRQATDTNIFTWWREHGQQFPDLATLARMVHSIPASSYNAGMCASAAADEINFEFDLNVIAEKMAERYVKAHCSKAHILNKETKVAKKPMGSDKHPKSFKHHNIDGKDSSLTMIDPEANVMDSSIHINTNNAGSHHEKNFDNNDDFFVGLDDFLDKSMAQSTIGTSVVQAYKPSAFITESQSHNEMIGNGSSIVTDKNSEYNNDETQNMHQNIEPNVEKKRKGIDELNTSPTNKKSKGVNNIAHNLNKTIHPRHLSYLIAKAHNIEENRDYDPHSIAESKSSNNSISNGSSGNMHQDFNNLILESRQNRKINVNKKRKVS
uniref:HAT C-terminal dimerisation domain-containing protein n=1 Tax=Meloidogyne javanica TaxID=6303 RepID=A0A915LFW4_MELJA